MTRSNELSLHSGAMKKMSTNSSFLHRIVFSDECVFHVSGIANTQNTRIWGTKNPREVQQHERNGEKLTLWCAIHSQGVLDPYYFDNETVRKEDYCELLDSYVRAEAENFPDNALFQQNDAPHTLFMQLEVF